MVAAASRRECDRDRLPGTADDLAAAHLHWCKAIARRLTRRRPWDRDEAESAALVALAEAIRTFRDYPGPGDLSAKFARHVNTTVRGRVGTCLRDSGPKGYRGRGERSATATAGRPAVASLGADAPAIPDGGGPVGWEVEWEDFVTAMSAYLPRRHGEAFRYHHLHAGGGTSRAVGAHLGLSKSRAVQLLDEATGMLRERFRGKGGVR